MFDNARLPAVRTYRGDIRQGQELLRESDPRYAGLFPDVCGCRATVKGPQDPGDRQWIFPGPDITLGLDMGRQLGGKLRSLVHAVAAITEG